METTLLAAFLGGGLSLFSPCSALLLPAFFAFAFGTGWRLASRTLVFYAGLCLTLVPLGAGAGAISSFFYGYRGEIILASGVLVMGFGVLQILGLGSGLRVATRFGGRVTDRSAASILVLGSVYGFAGFCSGPALGAILTVAAASGQASRGAVLLAVYALGMAAPLFALALFWDRFDLGRRRWLRGREIGPGSLRLHTTNLISGSMFIVLGALFVFYEGTSSLSGLYERFLPTSATFAAQNATQALGSRVPDQIFLIVAAAALVGVVLWLLAVRVRKERAGNAGGREASSGETDGSGGREGADSWRS
ncbi:Cytochrome C biogenesis protein transmembrane region (plasmid) [Rubrobacter radiotolerans]|uniref:Cytochrome C biogenesis protein transmembrane region n=1 Tax=Rubrobacter radiotolerans TaxID=42256 RepID=A0A023X7P3_RUBRA|nr:cytochrome c biogenesis CcdA family protein [Rubrobacter radiotolerans]AHY48363.1 Cytochrome C biogenesis protein transmembrane region [Rubrobacter radiotolerans]MDX5895500.1 cytochrome c biogenesis CcdA family protein [Rubrobacter radiotolerans]SMC01562.1 Cytochrome c biogenesis protein CcdA [Rubrobacter radiotolerans DSM 5868]